MEGNDAQLLEAYACQKSDAAFAELARRYMDLVHGAALRQVRDAHLADDVTQCVFIVLARRAGHIRGEYLPGWLLKTTYFCAADARKRQRRRERYEQQAATMKNSFARAADSSQAEIAEDLDAAMSRLKPKESTALAMRYLQNCSMAEVASAMGISHDAAQKIVLRALPKLRRILVGRGLVLSSTAGLSEAMTLASHHVAPASLTITSTLPSTNGISMAKIVMKLMFWSKAHTIGAMAAGAVVVASGAGMVLSRYDRAAVAEQTVITTPAMQTTNAAPYTSPFLELENCRIIRPVQMQFTLANSQPLTVVKAYEEEELRIDCTLSREIVAKIDRISETIIAEDGTELSKQESVVSNGKGNEVACRFTRVAPPAGDYVIRVEAMDGSKNVVARRAAPLHVDPLMETMAEVCDILPNGSLRFLGVKQQPNNGESAISDDHLNAGGRFDTMFDSAGRPIAFKIESTPTGNIIRFTMNNPVQPQQAIIFGATGGISKGVNRLPGGVLRFSEQDIEPAPTRYLNLYRLPAGAKLLSVNSTRMQTRTVDGHIQIYLETIAAASRPCQIEIRYQLANP